MTLREDIPNQHQRQGHNMFIAGGYGSDVPQGSPGGACYPISQGIQHQRNHQGDSSLSAARGGRITDLGRMGGSPGVGHVASDTHRRTASTAMEDLACRCRWSGLDPSV